MSESGRLPPKPEGSLRILAFSDWRVQDHEELVEIMDEHGPISLIVYAGDDLDRFFRDGRNYFKALARRTTLGQVLAVAGNDDEPELAEAAMARGGAWNLHKKPYVIPDVAFLGNEGSTRGPGFLKHTEAQVAAHLKRQAKITRKSGGTQVTILVSHTPPHGTLDIGRRFGVEHIGSTSVRDFIEQEKPTLVICGHCHGFGGVTEQLPNGTTVLNIASHDDEGADARFAIIDITREGKLSIHSTTTREVLHKHELLDLLQVGPQRLQHFLRLGIKTLADVQEKNRSALRKVPGAGDWHVERWVKQAAILRGEAKDLLILNPQKLAFLDTDRFVVWDVETNIGQDRVWLIGAKDTHTGEVAQFFDPDNERKCFSAFCTWLEKRPKHALVSYSGSRFEGRTAQIVLGRHKLTRHKPRFQLDNDLGHHIQYDCVGPYRQFELKKLAPAMGFNRFRHPGMNGLHVGMIFTRYMLSKKPPDSWQPFLEYNEDDVLATEHVLKTLRAALQR